MASNLFNLGRYFKKDPQTGQSQSVNSDDLETKQNISTVGGEQRTVEPYNGIGRPKTASVSKAEEKVTQKGSASNTQSGTDENNTQGSPAPAPLTAQGSSIDMNKRSNMDVVTRLTQRSNQAIMNGVSKAKQLGSQYTDTEHMLWGLLSDQQIFQIITDLKVTPKEIQDYLEKNFKKGTYSGPPQFSPRVKKVLELSLSIARSLKLEFISPEHILLALVQEGEGMAAQTLIKFNITVEALNKKVTGKKEGVGEDEKEKKSTGTINEFCEDLTQKAREGKLDPVVGRSVEIERAIHILSRRTKNNPVLIGDAGVGKTAIVEGLAQRIARGDVPESLLNKRILQLDLMSIIAGARHRGEFEERLKNLIKEIKASAGTIILFIDEIHNMVGAGSGGEGTMDTSNILKPSLARGELQTIGTTTITEYRKYIEKDPALERRFQPVIVLEPTDDAAIEMLHALRDKYEAFHKVSIPDEAIEAAVRLSKRYVGDRFLPDKAVDLIDEGAAAVRLPAISLPEEIKGLQNKLTRLDSEKKEAEKINDTVRFAAVEKETKETTDLLEEKKQTYEKKKSQTTNVVSPEVIQEIVSQWTNIPISKLTEKETDKLLKLEDLIHKRIINQEQAVSSVAEAVRRGRAGLKSGKRPIGSFIFMGPTGVGKTELAKALAEILFGSDEMMIRLDMSEYMERHEVAKLIGAPPGYVGYDEGGQLTEAVRRHPYSVVLFDEIEKAHPDVFNILIQLLDDGRVTDNKGRTVSFKNTIVICTSNIGTGLIQSSMLTDSKTNEDKDLSGNELEKPEDKELNQGQVNNLEDKNKTEKLSGEKEEPDVMNNQNMQSDPASDQNTNQEKVTEVNKNEENPVVAEKKTNSNNEANPADQNIQDLNKQGPGEVTPKPGEEKINEEANTSKTSSFFSPGKIKDDNFETLTNRLLEELRKFFRPELLNRFDELIVFKPLKPGHMIQIVDLQISQLAKLLEDQGFGFQATPMAKEKLAAIGFDPIYGARPLRRTIQRFIENPISNLLIKGEAKAGDIITVDLSEDEEFRFDIKKSQIPKKEELSGETKNQEQPNENKDVKNAPPSQEQSEVNGQPQEESTNLNNSENPQNPAVEGLNPKADINNDLTNETPISNSGSPSNDSPVNTVNTNNTQLDGSISQPTTPQSNENNSPISDYFGQSQTQEPQKDTS